MAHFNFVISQNAKWGHAGFYIDRHRMTSLLTCAWLISILWLVLGLQSKINYAYRKIFFYKKTLILIVDLIVREHNFPSIHNCNVQKRQFYIMWYN